MISTLHSDFSLYLARNFLEEIQYQRNNYYYFLGNKSLKDEFPISTLEDTIEIRNNILFMDKLFPANVSLGIKKYVWSSGTVYDKWDHTQDMSNKQFYVITSDLSIYKCLDNGNGLASTVEPAGNDLYTTHTSDGYTWKYMYSISTFHNRKFSTPQYIPVQRALSESFYSRGSVSAAIIESSGSGYEETLLTKIKVSSGGAVLLPQIDDNGSIIGVTIVSGGSNYSSAPILTVEVPRGGDAVWSGKFGNTSAQLEAIIQNGSVVHVAILDPGINYPKLSETQIVVQGDGYGAKIMPIVYQGQVIDAVLLDGGHGYTYIKCTVVGNGTGATCKAVFDPSFVQSDQSDVEQLAVDGAIHSIHVQSGGANYTSNASITIEGDGVGATAQLVIDHGNIIRVRIINPGKNYTWATPRVTDSTGHGAEMYCILPPYNGHGFDAPRELFAKTVLITSTNRDYYGFALQNQQYNNFGITVGFRNLSDNSISRGSGKFNLYECTFGSTLNLSIDDVLMLNSLYAFRVVHIDNATVYLQPMQKNSPAPSGILYNQIDVNRQYSVQSTNASPTINTHTGEILCLTDDVSFGFSYDQIITIKTSIDF